MGQMKLWTVIADPDDVEPTILRTLKRYTVRMNHLGYKLLTNNRELCKTVRNAHTFIAFPPEKDTAKLFHEGGKVSELVVIGSSSKAFEKAARAVVPSTYDIRIVKEKDAWKRLLHKMEDEG